MNNLLTELVVELIKNSDANTIIDLCKINKKYHSICDDDYLMKSILKREFPFIIIPKHITINLQVLKQYIDAFNHLEDFLGSRNPQSLSFFDDFDMKTIDKNSIDLFIFNLEENVFKINFHFSDYNFFENIDEKKIYYILHNLFNQNTVFQTDFYHSLILQFIEYNHSDHLILLLIKSALKNHINVFNSTSHAYDDENDTDIFYDNEHDNLLMQFITNDRFSLLDHCMKYIKQSNALDTNTTAEIKDIIQEYEEDHDDDDEPLKKLEILKELIY